jgi:transcriptional regulator with XRE-family HTH domain
MTVIPDPQAMREARKRKGLTQVELAQELGVRPQTISRAEKGDRSALGLSTVNKIADLLGVDRDSLKMDVPDEELDQPLASTPEERDLLRRFRRMNRPQQASLLASAWALTSPYGPLLQDGLLGSEILSLRDDDSRDLLKLLSEAERRASQRVSSAVNAVEAAGRNDEPGSPRSARRPG